MKLSIEHIKVLLLAAVVVYLFIPKRKDAPPDRSAEIKALEELVKAKDNEREIYRAWKDEVIATLRQKDSLLKNDIKTTVIKYEKVPVIVGDYSREELRRAVENY